MALIRRWVQWTAEDKTAVANEVLRLYAKKGVKADHVEMLELVCREVLPKAKWKSGNAIAIMGHEWSKKFLLSVVATNKASQAKKFLDTPITAKKEPVVINNLGRLVFLNSDKDKAFIEHFITVTTQKKRKRVFWPKEELMLVHNEVQAMYNCGKGEIFDHETILILAQQVLDNEERWRYPTNLTSDSEGKWQKQKFLRNVVPQVLELHKEEKEIVTSPLMTALKEVTVTAPEPSSSVEKTREEVKTSSSDERLSGGIGFHISAKTIELMIEKAINIKIGEVLDKADIPSKIDEMISRVGVRLESGLTPLENLVLDMIEAKSQGKEKLEIKQPDTLHGAFFKIAVCGPTNHQSKRIKEALKMFNLDITYYHSDNLGYDINPNFDKVFWMTKFVSHSQQEAVQRVYSGKDIIKVNGGMHCMKNTIIKYMYPDYKFEVR
jgi:hypothetical protein